MAAPARTLEARLLAFGRTLRREGFLVSAAEVALALRALEISDLTDRREVRTALAAVFAKSPLERRRFERLFEQLWEQTQPRDSSDDGTQLPPPRRGARDLELLDWSRQEDDGEELHTMSYSAREVIAERDFARVEAHEAAALQRLVAKLARRLATRLSRREALAQRRSEHADLRRTIRRSLGHGGEPFDLAFRRRRKERTRFVFLFDVSGSMSTYSRFLLQLAYAVARQPQLGRSEVFGFATRLYRLTDTLRTLGVNDALRAARLAMPGRSGGTRIGASLREFLDRFGGGLTSRTVVVIASDGWDTGELLLLEGAMRTLQRRSAKVLWLNPLAGSSGYRPTAAGMQTALPFVDVFAPAHNLQSLRALEGQLLRGTRSRRRTNAAPPAPP